MAQILLWLHLLSLAVGGAATFGNPILRAAMASAPDAARPVMAGVARRLVMVGRGALVVLILTGVAMILLGAGFGAMGLWFWIKMALVVLLTFGIVQNGLAAKRLAGGDTTAGQTIALWSKINMGVLAAIILCAVLAFG